MSEISSVISEEASASTSIPPPIEKIAQMADELDCLGLHALNRSKSHFTHRVWKARQ